MIICKDILLSLLYTTNTSFELKEDSNTNYYEYCKIIKLLKEPKRGVSSILKMFTKECTTDMIDDIYLDTKYRHIFTADLLQELKQSNITISNSIQVYSNDDTTDYKEYTEYFLLRAVKLLYIRGQYQKVVDIRNYFIHSGIGDYTMEILNSYYLLVEPSEYATSQVIYNPKVFSKMIINCNQIERILSQSTTSLIFNHYNAKNIITGYHNILGANMVLKRHFDKYNGIIVSINNYSRHNLRSGNTHQFSGDIYHITDYSLLLDYLKNPLSFIFLHTGNFNYCNIFNIYMHPLMPTDINLIYFNLEKYTSMVNNIGHISYIYVVCSSLTNKATGRLIYIMNKLQTLHLVLYINFDILGEIVLYNYIKKENNVSCMSV